MLIGRYLVKAPTLVLGTESEGRLACTIPAGSLISVDSPMFNGDRLIDVSWNGKTVMMLAEDLRARTVPATLSDSLPHGVRKAAVRSAGSLKAG